MTLKSHFPLQWQTGLGLVPITISLPYAWLYKHGDSLAQFFKANLLSHLHFIALFNNNKSPHYLLQTWKSQLTAQVDIYIHLVCQDK